MHMSSEFTVAGRVGLYEPFRVMSMWEDSSPNTNNTGGSTLVQVDAHPSWFDSMRPSRDEEGKKPYEKVKRRLAQNREAARKSRLRKKAYVQQLESSRLKLAQIEQDVARARQEGLYIGMSGTVNSGIGSFEIEYSHWIEEQQRHSCQLREALQSDTSPTQLRNLVETVLKHYYSLFRMKAEAARADVFYLLSGLWRSSAERFFLWIGGSRPSDLLQVLMPHFDPLTDQQMVSVSNLRHSSQQAEDALSQGMDKLQQTLSQILVGTYPHMEDAMEQLETMESFVNQADHLRQQTLQQMSRILTTRQAARGLLGLGDYFHRLAALSSLWAARPCQPT